MISKVPEVQSVNPVQPTPPQPVESPANSAETVQAVQPVQSVQPDLRLIIEEDPDSGAFVYKTLDRSTGEVVRQIPAEDVLKLKREMSYEAGAVVSKRV